MRSVIALGPVVLVLLVGTGGFAPATVAASDSGKARHVVVFDGEQPPTDFTARVGGLGGIVLNVFGGVGFATVEGLTETAVEELRSASGVSAVEPDLIVGAESADEPATTDVAAAAAAEVSIESHTSPTNAVEYARQWNLRAIGAEGAWAAGYLGSEDVSQLSWIPGLTTHTPTSMGASTSHGQCRCCRSPARVRRGSLVCRAESKRTGESRRWAGPRSRTCTPMAPPYPG